MTLITSACAPNCHYNCLKKTLVAAIDPVALDAYVAKAYWNLESRAIPYLEMAEDRGLGSLRFDRLRTQIIALDANSDFVVSGHPLL